VEKDVLINVDSEFDYANIAAAARKVITQEPHGLRSPARIAAYACLLLGLSLQLAAGQ
jgi:hypothetical protein